MNSSLKINPFNDNIIFNQFELKTNYNNTYSDTDSDTDSNNTIIHLPSELVKQYNNNNNKNNHISEFDTDSDDYDINNVISVRRQRKSFIKKSLKNLSHRIHNLDTNSSLHYKNVSFFTCISNYLFCKIDK